MSHKLRIVFDTNIFISAIIFGGNPRKCLEFARNKKIQLFTSKAILLELAEKLSDKFFWNEVEIKDVIQGITVFTAIVSPSKELGIIPEDPDDNRILECALEAGADFIVSGDKKHLLSLKSFRKIPIISAKEFLDVFYNQIT
ncbi:putative toxin-antitoxin system toxin component, PIN family [Candidatus Daviesbacteria bacterium]|nr:putative toxin-antitoxin system toxin component, PIN family [Candidatus Daviesbacteria bacterium]